MTRALGELLGSDPFCTTRGCLKGEPGLERDGRGTLLEWEEECRELELDSVRTVAVFTLALGRKVDGDGEEVGECFAGEGGLEVKGAAFTSSLAVACIERSTGRQRRGGGMDSLF